MLTTLDSHVVIEHEEGFNKAMHQAAFLLKVDPIAVGLDIHQDVFGREMKPVEADLADDAEEGGEEGEPIPNKAGDE